jgi:hypothetical protein
MFIFEHTGIILADAALVDSAFNKSHVLPNRRGELSELLQPSSRKILARVALQALCQGHPLWRTVLTTIESKGRISELDK